MLHRYLIAEFLKLRRSLVLLLCIAAPSCVVILSTLGWLSARQPAEIGEFALGASSLWAFLMIPLAVTALGILLAQLEHAPRSWNHILTLPGARPHAFLAKALVMLVLIAGMSALLWAEILAGSALVMALRDNVTGELHPRGYAALLSRITAATILMAMLQLWVALRFRSFVPPLVFGIAGTFVAIAASQSENGVYIPWQMAGKIMADPQTQQTALLLGSLGGVAVMLAMLVDLGRREA